MPCYLFTYHAYRSWMPDRQQGYVRRHIGVLPRDVAMASRYEQRATFPEMRFSHRRQRWMIETLAQAAHHLNARLHYVATDISHLHALVSWDDEATWQHVRNSLKKSLTISLKKEFGDRPWFSDGASRKRVRDRAHFDYLITTYLPKHNGWKWCERDGYIAPARRSSPAIEQNAKDAK